MYLVSALYRYLTDFLKCYLQTVFHLPSRCMCRSKIVSTPLKGEDPIRTIVFVPSVHPSAVCIASLQTFDSLTVKLHYGSRRVTDRTPINLVQQRKMHMQVLHADIARKSRRTVSRNGKKNIKWIAFPEYTAQSQFEASPLL
jgi:hypothetical protein